MNITFSELDDFNNLDEQLEEFNQNPYFNEKMANNNSQKIKPIIKKKTTENDKYTQQKREKKKGISYDDILSSMNTVVIDGKLEFIRNDSQMQPEYNEENYIQPSQQIHKKKVNFGQQQQPIDPNLKNSYIYNKFFKDYKDPEYISQPKVPLSKQQIVKQILIDKVNRHNNQIRISQIKSTRLLFNANNNNIIRSSPFFNQNGSNHLFKFKG
jgi:hypothetical protein